MIEGKIQFVAQIKEWRAKALVSGDKSYRILLETNESASAICGIWPGDETVSVTIERNKKGN